MTIRKLAVAAVLSMGLAAGAVAEEAQEKKNPADPWEGFNRGVFAFNDAVDGAVLKPIAKGYKAVTPDVVETGVSNVFSNLGEVGNIVNGLLQFKLGQASNDTGRLLINSTFGLAGIFDVAKHMGLEKGTGEDFGQTLAAWGVESGPYVVLPLLGPTTVRDGVGLPADSYLNPISHVDHVPTRNSAYGADLIDTRASLLGAEGAISGDKYSFIRDAYLQRREYLINDGKVEDDFGADLDEEEDF
ncbi:MlaA family lipoprotein [Pseudoteredinibacter isoporae]|uniref:MlaA family lipoprotein n=1 Tax=Pseudoteredinibacter isoporae TaxID=570281 RepID=UPI0031085CD0